MSITVSSAEVLDGDGKVIRPTIYEHEVSRIEKFTLLTAESQITRLKAELAKWEDIKTQIGAL
jgi:hypothetical protein